jgi:hypothetical protein
MNDLAPRPRLEGSTLTFTSDAISTEGSLYASIGWGRHPRHQPLINFSQAGRESYYSGLRASFMMPLPPAAAQSFSVTFVGSAAVLFPPPHRPHSLSLSRAPPPRTSYS